MILSNLSYDDSWYPAALRRALDYVRRQDFSTMEAGDHPIEGDLMYAKVFDMTSGDLSSCKAEFHDRYLDVQYWVNGEELLGCSGRTGDEKIIESHPERDLYFCTVPEKETMIHVHGGDFVVFFPSDIHRPGGAWQGKRQSYRKVVVKVSVLLLGGK